MEVCKGGLWGTVCDSTFDSDDVAFVCNMLGFSKSGKAAVHNKMACMLK